MKEPDRRCLESQMFLLMGLYMDLVGLNHFEFLHWGNSSKVTKDIQGGTELYGIRERELERQLSSRQK